MAAYVAQGYVSVTDLTSSDLFDQAICQNLQWCHDNRSDTNYYGGTPMHGTATADLVMTASWQDIVGGSASLPQTGTWLVQGTWGLQSGAPTGGIYQLLGRITAGGTVQAGSAVVYLGNSNEATITQQWALDIATQPVVVKMQSGYSAVAPGGNGTVVAANTSIVCTLMSAP